VADDGHSVPEEASADAVTIVNLADPVDQRRGGTAFGMLIHAVLAQASFEARFAELQAVAAAEARLLGLDPAAADAAARLAERLLNHELLARARAASAAGRCRRETPVTMTMPDGTLVEGVVDLAFEENGVWTVVDYKTDRELQAAGEERYRRQVALYAAAIARATGDAAKGVVVRL
jgi:ATP-dependent exoDNAse (exonuclease V) beta subunit